MLKSLIPNIKFLRKIVFVTFSIAFIFSSGYIFGYQGYSVRAQKFPSVNIVREVPANKGTLDFDLFWKVWDTLESKYFDKSKVIPAKMVYGAISGMVAALDDPYTVFLPPTENKIVTEDLQGNFQGVGIQIGFKGNQLVVIAPLASSPAEKVGIKAGDFILGIKDEKKSIDISTAGITLPDAVQAIRGSAGTKVTLMLLREGTEEPFEKVITRENIDVPSIVSEYVGKKDNPENKAIVHIRLLKFSGETVTEWEDIVTDILEKPEVKGIILDVRNNPGGYLQGAVELASDFLDTGSVVVIEDDGDNVKQEYRVEKLGRLKSYKVVVLVNKGSASASEILSGALRDIGKIELIGETTFGKGTIQEPQQINGGSGLHITIAKWLTPSGFWVNDGGLKPDIEVEDNQDTEEDEQLQKAIEVISDKF